MAAVAAGMYRRSALERADQRVSWERGDPAFFASRACHILAWACRDAYADQGVGVGALFLAGAEHPFHVCALWEQWAFDFSGWHASTELIGANVAFEGQAIECRAVADELPEFCAAHLHRPPEQFWDDPAPRARRYLDLHRTPWATGETPVISQGYGTAYDGGMTVDLFAGIAVSDYATALTWYEKLLGSPPAFFPNDAEAVWEIAEHRYLYIEHLPAKAGHAMHTLFVDDFDERTAAIAGRGLTPATQETYGNGVRKAIYADPDGNEIGFGGGPA
jgi:hypothetical protein